MLKMLLVGAGAVFAAEFVGGMSAVAALPSPAPSLVKYATGGVVVLLGHKYLKT